MAAMARETSAFGGRSTREPELLLEDSVVRVRQLIPSLPPSVVGALQADAYASPSVGGLDRDTDYAYCATSEYCYVWRSSSATPTCYTFPVPPFSSAQALPHCVFLPRPLNSSAEPALMLCSKHGDVVYWDTVSDAFTAQAASSSTKTAHLTLSDGEVVTTATRMDASQVLLGTSHSRLFRVHVFVLHGHSQLQSHLITESRGLLGRWFGGSHAAGDSHVAVHSLVVTPPTSDGVSTVLAVSAHGMQVWSVPLIKGTSAAGSPRLLHADTGIHKTLASRILYARGQRYSAADANRIALADAAYMAREHACVLLYIDRTRASASYGLAIVDMPTESATTQTVRRLLPLHYEQAEDPRPTSMPRLHVSSSQPSVAFVTFSGAVVAQLLADPCGSDEVLKLRHGADRILGACLPSDTSHVRWTALTSNSGLLFLDIDVARAQQHALDEEPTSPRALEAQAERLQERLERAVWFEDETNPLQLDALPDRLDTVLLEQGVARMSEAILTSRLTCMPATIDLRTQLAQRVVCAERLVQVLGRNGYWAPLSIGVRAQVRAEAELVAGASDMWRLYDAETRMPILASAIQSVLGDAQERTFFERELVRITDVLAAMQAQLRPSNAVAATRLVLALYLGAMRFRAEHMELYQLPSIPAMSHVPWYATATWTDLLESLFDAAQTRLSTSKDPHVETEARTQLCALAEGALHAYEARLACLGHDEDARHGVQAQFDRTRPALLHPLLHMGRADKAYALAEQHRDFATLVALCFDHGPSDTKRAKHAHPSTPALAAKDVRVEQYLDTYGMAFATELYQYYIQHGATRRLLEPQPEHAALVTQFLAAHPEHARIAWLHDVAQGSFAQASATLAQCASREQESIEAKQQCLSLGKLMHLASLTSMADVQTQAEQTVLETWDDQLDLVHVQTRLKRRWDEAAMLPDAPAPEAQADHLVQMIAPHLGEQRPALRTLFVTLAAQVVQGHVVQAEDMMELLTLPERAFAASPDMPLTDFAMAAQVLVRTSMPAARREAARMMLWRRLYLLDDWYALSETAQLSDEQVLTLVRGTAAFHTVQNVLADASTASLLASPDVVAASSLPPRDALAERFPGLPAEQLDSMYTAYEDETHALQQMVRETKLSAFFARIVALSADAAAESAPGPTPAVDQEMADGSTDETMPGAASVAMLT